MMFRCILFFVVSVPPLTMSLETAVVRQLTAQWSLERDSLDSSGNGLHLSGRDVHFGDQSTRRNNHPTASFDGRSGVLTVADDKRLDPGTGRFSISAWVHTNSSIDDVLGDVVSKFDPARRTGFELSIKNNVGVTNTSANYRHVHFGIDNAQVEKAWTDHGRPGNNMYVFSLLVHRGQLYAGTCEPGINEAGHVYLFDVCIGL